jgi:hypothetical protein
LWRETEKFFESGREKAAGWEVDRERMGDGRVRRKIYFDKGKVFGNCLRLGVSKHIQSPEACRMAPVMRIACYPTESTSTLQQLARESAAAAAAATGAAAQGRGAVVLLSPFSRARCQHREELR